MGFCLPNGESLEPFFFVHHTHGSEHVVFKPVRTVQLQRSLTVRSRKRSLISFLQIGTIRYYTIPVLKMLFAYLGNFEWHNRDSFGDA